MTIVSTNAVSFKPAASPANGAGIGTSAGIAAPGAKSAGQDRTAAKDKFIPSNIQEMNPYDEMAKRLPANGKNSKTTNSADNNFLLENNKNKTEKVGIPGNDKANKDEQDNGKISNPFDKKETKDEKENAKELKTRDQEVRSHEQAHLSAGGGLVRGGAKFEYTVGPDGKQYAVGGEVQIDISPVPGNPQATIQKMQQVRRAALAPSDPSSQDLAVASQATELEAEAARQLQRDSMDKQLSKSKIMSVSSNRTAAGATAQNSNTIKAVEQYKKADEIKHEEIKNLSLNQVL